MIDATCRCGAIRLTVPLPAEVTDCNCSVCRRYGVLWVYYSPREVTVAGAPTDRYRGGKATTDFHRCATCGCVTHWSAVDPERDRMGVNARLLPPEVLAAVRVRHLDGAVTDAYLD